MQTYHENLASGRWQSMTIAEQLGNVGSEYERALRCKARGDADHFDIAFGRMLELLDLTITDPRWKNHRLKELCRLREVVYNELCNETPEFNHPTDLRNYFLYFGILARNERDRAADAVVV